MRCTLHRRTHRGCHALPTPTTTPSLARQRGSCTVAPAPSCTQAPRTEEALLEACRPGARKCVVTVPAPCSCQVLLVFLAVRAQVVWCRKARRAEAGVAASTPQPVLITVEHGCLRQRVAVIICTGASSAWRVTLAHTAHIRTTNTHRHTATHSHAATHTHMAHSEGYLVPRRHASCGVSAFY